MEVFYTPKFFNISKKACNRDSSWEDCHQEAVISIYERGIELESVINIEAFFYVCVWQIFKNHKRLKINQSVLINQDFIDEVDDTDHIFSIIESELEFPSSTEDWYLKNLLKAYNELGTYKAVSEKTGIPVGTVYRDVKNITQKLKEKLLK